MRIRVGFDIAYRCEQPTPLLVMLSLHPSRHAIRLTPEELLVTTDPASPVAVRSYRDGFDNIVHRLVAPAGVTRFQSDFVVSASDDPDMLPIGAGQTEIDDLPDDAIQFLLPSRYCDTEKLMDIAWANFGGVAPGWPRVQAILDYVKARARFSYAEARPDRTAFDMHQEQVAVCRDFAHLTCALCRCMNIPARYVTGWLGDVRWPRSPGVMDFSGWSQVHLDGRWWDIDGRHNAPRHGRVLMGIGRDAADVAISTQFGRTTLERFYVIADEVDPPAEWADGVHHREPPSYPLPSLAA